MSQGEEPKRYNTNPLDKRVAENAEAEMGDGSAAASVDTEAPTREMPASLIPPPDAGGATGSVAGGTGPTPVGGTTPVRPHSSGEIANPTRGMHEAPLPQPYATPQAPYASPQAPYAGRPAPYAPPQQAPYAPPAAYPPQQSGHPYTPPAFHGYPAVGQQPSYPPQPGSAPTGSEALGLKPNFAAMLGYLPFVGIAAAFLLVIVEPAHNRFVRFHAKQALIAQIAFWVVLTAFNLAHAHVPTVLSVLLYLPEVIFIIGSIVGFVMMMTKAYGGIKAKIPIIGDQAE